MQKETTKELVSWVKAFAIALLIAFIVRQFLFAPVVVQGQSMEPTFESNNRVIISKIHTLERFDLIVFHAPGAEEDYIKRVIGLPGDRVVMEDDVLTINGKKYDEYYIEESKEQLLKYQKLTEDFDVVVPEGQLFVLGDNRMNSIDSRTIGCIDEESVVGKVKLRIYPFDEIGIPK